MTWPTSSFYCDFLPRLPIDDVKRRLTHRPLCCYTRHLEGRVGVTVCRNLRQSSGLSYRDPLPAGRPDPVRLLITCAWPASHLGDSQHGTPAGATRLSRAEWEAARPSDLASRIQDPVSTGHTPRSQKRPAHPSPPSVPARPRFCRILRARRRGFAHLPGGRESAYCEQPLQHILNSHSPWPCRVGSCVSSRYLILMSKSRRFCSLGRTSMLHSTSSPCCTVNTSLR